MREWLLGLKKRFEGWLLLLVTVPLIFILPILYFGGSGVDKTTHMEIVQGLLDLKEMHANFVQRLLETRHRVQASYDPLVEAQQVYARQIRSFGPLLLTSSNQQVASSWSRFEATISSVRSDIEEFKSLHAVFNNSLDYFPTLATETIRDPALPRELSPMIDEVTREILVYTVGSRTFDLQSIERSLRDLQQGSTANTGARTILEPFLLHANVILRYPSMVDRLLSSANLSAADAALEEVLTGYQANFKWQQNKADRYRYVLFLLSVILVSSIIWSLLHIRFTTFELKETVRQLELQKDALDQHAIVSITDRRGRITYANDKLCEISEYSREQLLGQNHRIVKSDQHLKEFFQKMWTEITSGRVWHGEIKNRTRTGSHYWVRSTIVPFLDKTGKPYQYVSIRTDITESKRMEQDLIKAKEDAEKASRAKSNFLANMSHEIRTPMNAIIGMSNLALQGEIDPKQQEYLSHIHESAKSLLRIINDILDLSKIEAGKLDIELISFGIGEVFDNLANMVSIRAHEKGLELLFTIDPAMPACLIGDPLRVNQILLNLVGNAIKFTPKGEVEVTANLLEQREDRCIVKFLVRDTGIGFSEEVKENLFRSFTQADSSTTRQYGGTGLGLMICKRLVELMSGSIEVESRPGQGSLFSFTARFVAGKAAPQGDNAQRISDRLGGLEVLLLDDNRAARRSISSMLHALAFQVTEAASASEAIALLEEEAVHPRLLLIDSEMPGTSGIETMKILSDRFLQCKLIPVILLHSTQERERLQRFLKDQPQVGLIQKPVTPSSLFNGIVTLMNRGLGSNQGTISRTALHPEHLPSFASRKILLIEDNTISQKVAMGLLKQVGVQVDIVDNGTTAVERASNTVYDLILMDIELGGMDGYTATRLIRSQEKTRVPIIAMTAHALVGDDQKSIEAGMDDHLTKPIDPIALYRMLDQWILQNEEHPPLDESSKPEETGNSSSPVSSAQAPQPFDQAQWTALLQSLEKPLHQRSPKPCAEIIGTILSSPYPRHLEPLVHQLEGMIKRYRFKEALQVLETLLSESKGNRE